MVGLWERRSSLVNTSPEGMKRRFEIARGLLHSPRVLFLDEPTVDLTRRRGSSIWGLHPGAGRRATITIFLTPLHGEAEHCDRIAIIDHGKIIVDQHARGAKASVGKNRVQIQTPDDDAAIAALAERFGIDAVLAEGAVNVPRYRGASTSSRAVRRARPDDLLGQRLAPLAR